MKDIIELRRLDAPAPRPQSIAFDGDYLWIGSIENSMIYQIDPKSWTVKWETKAPGLPWGMTVVGEELRVICGETEEDNRFVRRLIPGHGFDTRFVLPCPDDTGSQLGWDGKTLHISQWYNQRVLAIGENDEVERVISSPRGICGQAIAGSTLYLVNTAAEDTNDYFLTRFDLAAEDPVGEDLARIPFPARALAFDEEHFWTNHRAAGQSVRFRLPE